MSYLDLPAASILLAYSNNKGNLFLLLCTRTLLLFPFSDVISSSDELFSFRVEGTKSRTFTRMWSDTDARTKTFLLCWGAGRQLKASLMPESLLVISSLLGQLLTVVSQHEVCSSPFSLLTLVDPHMVLKYHAEKRCTCWLHNFYVIPLKSEELIQISSGVIENRLRPVKSNSLDVPFFFFPLMKESTFSGDEFLHSSGFRIKHSRISQVRKWSFCREVVTWIQVLCSTPAVCDAVIWEVNLRAHVLQAFAFMY